MKDYVIILKVGKCSWGKCNFCGWGKLDFGEKNLEELKEQFLRQYDKIDKNEEFRLKFYVSGSLFDNQVPEEFFFWLVDFLKEESKKNKIKAVLFESKIIDLLNKKRVEKFVELNEENIEPWVGIGFEGISNEELKLLKKEFQSVEQFLKITKTIKEKYKILFRVYFLINPPIPYNHYKTINDEIQYWNSWTYNNNENLIKKETERVKKIIEISKNNFEEVVLINTYPHKNSEAFDLFFNKKWRPLTEKEFKEIFIRVLKEFKKEFQIEKTKFELDFSNYAFIPQFPQKIKKEYREKIKGAKIDNLINRVYEIWEEYILYFYKPKNEREILFLLPCAAKKPYYLSKTHRLIKRTISGFQIFKKMHWVVVSNPGVIPYEFVDHWPFKNYDWPEWEETEEIKELYYKITKERVKRFLKKHSEHYKKIVTFFKPDSLTFEAVKKAIEELQLENKALHGIDRELYTKIKEKEKRPLFSNELLLSFKEKLKNLQKELV